jgi:hypothetical protein
MKPNDTPEPTTMALVTALFELSTLRHYRKRMPAEHHPKKNAS